MVLEHDCSDTVSLGRTLGDRAHLLVVNEMLREILPVEVGLYPLTQTL